MKTLFVLLVLLGVSPCFSQTAKIDRVFDAYWNAVSTRERDKATKGILASGVSFEEAYHRLAHGRTYSTNVKRGFFSLPQVGAQLPPNALVFVPYDYSPDKKYPIRVLLHGAVSNVNPDFVYQAVDTLNAAYKTSQVIHVYPAGWSLAKWWSDVQVKNIHDLVTWVKNRYNVDEPNIRLAGISDGGIGCFFLANSDPTMWSCFTPFIGSLAALKVLNIRPTYINNLSNKPFFIVNTGGDQLFRKEIQLPYLQLFAQANKQSKIVMVDTSRHSMSWYPVLRDSINQFADRHHRDSYPDSMVWQAESGEKYNRFHYLVVQELGKENRSTAFDDFNILPSKSQVTNAFPRDPLSGYVRLYKLGNTVHIKTANVKKVMLLLSPDHFDFQKPVVIYLNGEQRMEKKLTANTATLLKWNRADCDRTMLFGAEISIAID